MTRYELKKQFSVDLASWNTQLFQTFDPEGYINLAAADRQRDFSFTRYERTTVCDPITGCDTIIGPDSYSLMGQVTKIEMFADGRPVDVPEPSSLALFALGLAAAAARRRRSISASIDS